MTWHWYFGYRKYLVIATVNMENAFRPDW